MSEINANILARAKSLFAELAQFDDDDKIDLINEIRLALHEQSPMKDEPIDCVLWVRADQVSANDYNPNKVAPPEMKLLARSILEDGYTQPVVAWQSDDNQFKTVDGYHRGRCGKENNEIKTRVRGRLPITLINQGKSGRSDRIASTIRHNRARGAHDIGLMQSITADLVQSGMSDQWIMKHVGMDIDELLRLKQTTGLVELFQDTAFTNAWVKEPGDSDFYQ